MLSMSTEDQARLVLDVKVSFETIRKWVRGSPVSRASHCALRDACHRLGIPLPEWAKGERVARTTAK